MIYIIGATLGWFTELIYRRIAHHAWINPGFLVGPDLPLYGFGVLILYLICTADYSFIPTPAWRAVFVILLITFSMTALEYITGLIFIKGMKVKLWDYSDRWGNIQGIICPLFTFFWAAGGALYYLLIHPFVLSAVQWISANHIYSFFLGLYAGVLLVDICYSFRIVTRIRHWAAENRIEVRYEELKLAIRRRAEERKERRSFLLPFKSRRGLQNELDKYGNDRKQ